MIAKGYKSPVWHDYNEEIERRGLDLNTDEVLHNAHMACCVLYELEHGGEAVMTSDFTAAQYIDHYVGEDKFFECLTSDEEDANVSNLAEMCFYEHSCNNKNCMGHQMMNTCRHNLVEAIESGEVEIRETVSPIGTLITIDMPENGEVLSVQVTLSVDDECGHIIVGLNDGVGTELVNNFGAEYASEVLEALQHSGPLV